MHYESVKIYELNPRPRRKSRQSKEHIPIEKNSISRKTKTLQNNNRRRTKSISTTSPEDSVARRLVRSRSLPSTPKRQSVPKAVLQ